MCSKVKEGIPGNWRLNGIAAKEWLGKGEYLTEITYLKANGKSQGKLSVITKYL